MVSISRKTAETQDGGRCQKRYLDIKLAGMPNLTSLPHLKLTLLRSTGSRNLQASKRPITAGRGQVRSRLCKAGISWFLRRKARRRLSTTVTVKH